MALIPDRTEAFYQMGLHVIQAMREIYTALRGLLTLHDNLNIVEISFTFGAVADTSTDVDLTALGLTWIPTRVLTLETNDGAVIYPNDTAHTGWTTTTIKLKSSKASTVWIGTIY